MVSGKDKNDQLDLKEWELVCDKCEGKGTIISEPYNYVSMCQKCQGLGKVDWIENITGRKPQFTSSTSGYGTSGCSGTSGSSGIPAPSGISAPYELPIYNEIDKGIIESVISHSEQFYHKIRKAASGFLRAVE